MYGRKILTLASSDFTPHDEVEPLYNRVASPQKEVFGVPKVALSQFANFYEVRPAGQVKVDSLVKSLCRSN